MIDDDLYVFSEMEYDADHSASSNSIEHGSSSGGDPLISVRKKSSDDSEQKPVEEGRGSCLQELSAVLGFGLFIAILMGTIYGTIPWWILPSFIVAYTIVIILQAKKPKQK